MKRKHRSREFWENAVEYAEASGKTRAQCAKKFGVGEPALSYWVYKLRRERDNAGGGALVPVRVITPEPVAPQHLELDVDGALVRFAEGTSPEYVAQIAEALRGC